jgi:hypothetical protein
LACPSCAVQTQSSRTYSCSRFLYTCLMEKLPSRLPCENSEWWRIGDESRGGILLLPDQNLRDRMDKPEGFVIPLTVLQVRPFTVLDSHRLKTATHHNTTLGRRLSTPFSTPYKSGSAFARNGTRATPRGSTFSFIFEGKSRPRSRPWSASVLCKWSRCHQEKPKCERSSCSTS